MDKSEAPMKVMLRPQFERTPVQKMRSLDTCRIANWTCLCLSCLMWQKGPMDCHRFTEPSASWNESFIPRVVCEQGRMA